MKKLLTYCFLLIVALGIFGAPFVALAQGIYNPTQYQQLENARAAAEAALVDQIATKGAGYFDSKGNKITPDITTDNMGSVYYRSDGNGMILKYNAGANEVPDEFKAIREVDYNPQTNANDGYDDNLVAAFIKDSSGKYVAKPDSTPGHENDDDFLFNLAKANNLNTYGQTTPENYFDSLSKQANNATFEGGITTRQKYDQIYADRANMQIGLDNITKRIQELEAKKNNDEISQSELDELNSLYQARDSQQKAIATNGGQRDATQKQVNSALVKTTFAGLTLCGQWLNNSLDPWKGDTANPAWDLRGCIAAFVNLGIEAVSVPFVYVTELLDHVMDYSLTTFGSKFAKGGPLHDPVNNIWSLIKNICNLLFIVTLLYIAIKTIIDADGFQEKKTLMAVIICAVLINFSMLFTKFMIDVSNAASIQVFNALAESTEVAKNSNSVTQIGKNSLSQTLKADVGTKYSLANIFLSNMQIQKFVESGSGLNFGSLDYGYIFAYGLLSIIFILVSTVIIGAIVGMLIVRFVTLVVLLMTSPVAFLKYFAPGSLAGFSETWQKKFKENLVFLPVLMIMFYMTMVFAQFVSNQLKNNPNDYLQMIFGYVMTLTMLVLSMSVAKNLGGSAGAADWGSKWGKSIIGGATFGLAARASRRVVAGGGGWLANKTGASALLKNAATSNSFLLRATGASALAKAALKGGEKVQNATFDARNTGAVGKLGLGDGLKGGYAAVVKEREEDAKKRIEAQKKKASATKAETERANMAQAADTTHKDLENARETEQEQTILLSNIATELHEIDQDLQNPASIDAAVQREVANEVQQIDNQDQELVRKISENTRNMRGATIEEQRRLTNLNNQLAVERTNLANKKNATQNKLNAANIANTRADYERRTREKQAGLKKKQQENENVLALAVQNRENAEKRYEEVTSRLKAAGHTRDDIRLKVAEDKQAQQARQKKYLDYLERYANPSFRDIDASYVGGKGQYQEALTGALKDYFKSQTDKQLEKLIAQLNSQNNQSNTSNP